MNFYLDDNSLEALEEIQKDRSLTRKQYIKVTVLLMSHQGFSVGQIQSVLGIDDNSIYRYLKKYQQQGFDKLDSYLSDDYVAYQGKLSQQELQKLDAHLQGNCYATSEQIATWIKSTFGLTYTRSGIVDLLHRLDYVYKRSKLVSSKADTNKQESFLEEEFTDILEEVVKDQAVLYFSDGVHPTHQTHVGHGWIKKGKDFELQANTGRKRVNINAAINGVDPTDCVFNVVDRINKESTQDLCEQLLAKHSDKKVYLFSDNARYNHNKHLKEWTKDKNVTIVYLPSYSPNLNVIERLWRFMKGEILRHQHFERYEEFRQCVLDFISDLTPYREQLSSLLTLNFRTIGGKSYYFQHKIV